MKNDRQSQDPILDRFEAWLGSAEVSPPRDFLQRVRSRLREAPDPADELIDELLQLNPSMRDPRMLARVRRQLMEPEQERTVRRDWLPWLAPLAAAATLAFAFISFQSQVPREWPPQSDLQAGLDSQASASRLDEQTAEIFALASNLQGGTDLSKLDSVEDLAFLFD